MGLESKVFGTTKDGKTVHQFILRNKNGMQAHVINYGCCLTNLFVPCGEGPAADIVLGYDTVQGYEQDTTFQGAFVGRYANRIEGAAFEIEGKRYTLPKNDGENFLHGSLGKKVFDAEIIGDNSVSFTYISPDGEDGFPGELWIGVIYVLTDENELVMDYRAVAKKDTYVNFTNHSYFNLTGDFEKRIEDHTLWLNSTLFLEADGNLCPTGRALETLGSAFDFTTEKRIGQDIYAQDPQLVNAGGYDHCFVLSKARVDEMSMAAIAKDPQSGRSLRVYTTQPGVQLYTANFLDGKTVGKQGKPLAYRTGFCLETQHFPCSPSHPDFPSTLLKAGDKYHEVTVFQVHS